MAKSKKKTEEFKTEIEKIAKKIKISTEFANSIVLRYHELEHLIPKKRLKTLSLNMQNKKTMNRINKVAKALKVSFDAVIGAAALEAALKTEKVINARTSS